MVPMLTEEQLGLMVWSPLAGGLLSGKFGPGANAPGGRAARQLRLPAGGQGARLAGRRRDARGRRTAHGVSVARVALAWLLAKPLVISVIIGAKNTEQLDDNLAAADLTLTAEEMTHLDSVSALGPEYPGWMLARQGGARRTEAVREGLAKAPAPRSGGGGAAREARRDGGGVRPRHCCLIQ